MNKNILFVVNMIGRDGASRVISILANHYAMKGWRVDIITRKVSESFDLKEGVDINELGLKKLFRFQVYRAIRKYIQKNPNSVVVSFQPRMNMISSLATLGKEVRLVVSERNDIKVANPQYIFLLTDFIYRIKSVNAIVFQSTRVRNYYHESIINKSEIIYNPIRVSASRSNDISKKIVNAGRLNAQKNQKLLIEAFNEVHKTYSDYCLYIYGEGNLRNELEAQIEEEGLKDCVFLPGNTNNLHSEIADAEMFVLSSDFEGLSNALLEAMTMGIPCISTKCAGSDEIIKDEKNGLLVNIGDSKALSEAMIRVIRDTKLCETLSEGAKNTAKIFCYENVIRRWEKIIEN